MAGMGAQAITADVFFQMGLDRSIGRDGTVDRVAAHMWFNLAAARGNRDAALRRQEIASEMTAAEVAEAQRRAREWIRCH
ncbi:MAG: hypothetical protein GX458_11330 [Phyllobacteriaceae bacterium]|nr:hypothetical protein [Phyllobacteriaceae bacterium]